MAEGGYPACIPCCPIKEVCNCSLGGPPIQPSYRKQLLEILLSYSHILLLCDLENCSLISWAERLHALKLCNLHVVGQPNGWFHGRCLENDTFTVPARYGDGRQPTNFCKTRLGSSKLALCLQLYFINALIQADAGNGWDNHCSGRSRSDREYSHHSV